MTFYNVRHVTHYRYHRPVGLGEHRLMFRPRDSYDQRLHEAVLEVDPRPADIRWLHDPFGNCVALVRFSGKAKELRFETRIRVEHDLPGEPDLQIDPIALRYPFDYPEDEAADLARRYGRIIPIQPCRPLRGALRGAVGRSTRDAF